MTEIPEYGRACVLTGPGTFEIRDIRVPRPGRQEVLLKVRAVAICGSDPQIIRGELAGSWPPAYPFVAGHEWAGEVVAVGEGVTDLQVGDRVAGEAHKGCGYCDNCKRGRYSLCLNYGDPASGHEHYGFTVPGAYAQYQKYSVRSLSKMPDNVSFEEGALCDTAGVALHGLSLTGITPGGTVAVIGPGPIGICALRLAHALGAARVVMVGRGSRLASARRFGADELVDFTTTEPVAAVRALTDGLGVDQAFECSGAPGTFAQAVRMVRKGGAVGLLGVPADESDEPVPFKFIAHNEVAIFGSRADPNAVPNVLSLISSGALRVGDVISHRFPLEQFDQALATFVERRDNAVKVVVLPNGADEA
ncbi:MAG: alcohol dehydrogenase catalytic domain-containing protein [Micrococcales bacterium]|nr:alcohol dehydrogenase catalytic domain-containing protein [Micrococcales bacterium]